MVHTYPTKDPSTIASSQNRSSTQFLNISGQLDAVLQEPDPLPADAPSTRTEAALATWESFGPRSIGCCIIWKWTPGGFTFRWCLLERILPQTGDRQRRPCLLICCFCFSGMASELTASPRAECLPWW